MAQNRLYYGIMKTSACDHLRTFAAFYTHDGNADNAAVRLAAIWRQ